MNTHRGITREKSYPSHRCATINSLKKSDIYETRCQQRRRLRYILHPRSRLTCRPGVDHYYIKARSGVSWHHMYIVSFLHRSIHTRVFLNPACPADITQPPCHHGVLFLHPKARKRSRSSYPTSPPGTLSSSA